MTVESQQAQHQPPSTSRQVRTAPSSIWVKVSHISVFSFVRLTSSDLTWSQIIQLPAVTPSLVRSPFLFARQSANNPTQFDANGTLALEVTLSDASIFAPSATNIQTGFRRAELLPVSNNGSDPSTLGVKTLHFSVMKDSARNLNLSHEYQLVFLENAVFSTNQFVLKTGTIAGQPVGGSDFLVVQGNQNAVGGVQNLFNTSFTAATWHNFGLVLDFNAKYVSLLFPSSLCANARI